MITIHKQPPTFTPGRNDMIYVVSSDNTSQPNFKYIFDIYINNTFASRELRQPHPTLFNGTIDIKRFVSASLSQDFATTVGVTRNSNSFVTVQIKCGEQFGPSSGITNDLNLTNSNNIFAFSGALKTLDFIDFDYEDYYISVPDKGKFLTSRTRAIHNIKQSQNDYLSVLTNSSGTIYYVNVETYDHTNTLIQTAQFENPYQALVNAEDRFIKVPSGWNLNDVSVLTAGAQPILAGNIHYYKIYIHDLSDVLASEIITTYVQPSCSWGEEYDLHFINIFGFEETFRFTKWTTKTNTIDRKQLKRNTGTYSATDFVVSKSDRGLDIYNTKIENRWVLRSDFINDDMMAWVGEIISSPSVFINISGELIPVTIETNNYELITKQTNQLRNLELTIRLPDDYR